MPQHHTAMGSIPALVPTWVPPATPAQQPGGLCPTETCYPALRASLQPSRPSPLCLLGCYTNCDGCSLRLRWEGDDEDLL